MQLFSKSQRNNGILLCKTLSLVLCLFSYSHIQGQNVKPIYKDATKPVELRVKDLLQRMTPEEKFWQCFMIPGDLEDQYKHGIFGLQISASAKQGGAADQLLKYDIKGGGAETLARKINTIQKYYIENSRLGIPIIPFDEALHGLMREGATSFPQAIGLAASFDTLLMSQVATAIAKETRLRGIRQILTPVVNLANDVRWGRTEETYGEDPVLTAKMGVAFVSAFENAGIVSTPKHFLANVGEGGRDSYPIHWSKRYLEETHLYPFKEAFARGKSRSVMTAYNLLDGRPSTANHWLLTEKLKRDWKFNGFTISDASAVGGATVLHNTAKDYPDASAQAINAGLDVIFQTSYEHYKLFMPPFLDGRISLDRIDDAVSRVLRAKFELGLFDNPYVSEDEIKTLVNQTHHKKLAEAAAAASFVLLQNKDNALPISPKYKKIVVVGEEASLARLGGYAGLGNQKVSIIDGIKAYAKGKNLSISYQYGISKHTPALKIIADTFLFNNGKVGGLKGEYFESLDFKDSPKFMRIDPQIAFKWTLSSPDDKLLAKDQYAVRWTGELKSPATGAIDLGLRGNNGYRMYINNQLVVDRWEKDSYSTATSSIAMQKGKLYPIKIEFREMRGNANIELVWNYGIPDYKKQFDQALAAAKTADYVIVVAGIHEGEFQDRAKLGLEGNQEEFIRQLAHLNKPSSVVLVGGSAITTNNWSDKVGGILNVWYPGEEGGHAVAKTLFGEYNPSGKLPITYPVHEGQLPLTYNHHPTGRGDDYHHLSGEPLYPFGYGLSYTQFEFSNLTFDKTVYQKADTVTITATVKNVGTSAGKETVQLYTQKLLGSLSSPVLALKDFSKVELNKNESKTVTFKLPVSSLASLNEQMQWVVEPGEFRFMIGNSSKNLPLKQTISIQ